MLVEFLGPSEIFHSDNGYFRGDSTVARESQGHLKRFLGISVHFRGVSEGSRGFRVLRI